MSLVNFLKGRKNIRYIGCFSRRQSFRLRSGHKCAHLYTESAVYQYLKKLDAVKAWFRGNVEQVLNIYGPEHNIQKEDLFLGTPLVSNFVF